MRRFNEGEVVDRAMERFWRHGWEKTTMADLAAATGVQRGSLYNAYGGKAPILLMALDAYAARWRPGIEAALAKPEPHDAMAAFLDVHIERMADPTNPPGCLATLVATEAVGTEPSVAERIDTQFKRTEDALEAHLARAQSQGRLDAARDPRALALFFVGTSRGMAVMHKAHGGDIQIVRQIASEALGVLCRSPSVPP
ncbi:MAG: TetR/AcrR family transcriptional regulator [Pseudomonadota bacterium]